MPSIPITGDRTYDFALVIVVVIIGFGLALKADKPWGWALVAAAGYWAYRLVAKYM